MNWHKIVDPAYRQRGIARRIKYALFALSRRLFPQAKIFSITTNQAVMNLNTQLGFRPVAFAELPQEANFWGKCASCQNCDILARTGRKYCLCTGMLYNPGEHKREKERDLLRLHTNRSRRRERELESVD